MPYCGHIGELVEISRIGAEELSVKWQIQDVLSLPGRSSARYRSPEFSHNGESWRLVLMPNYKKIPRNLLSGFVRLDLYRRDGGLPKTFQFSVGIMGSRGVEKSREGEKEFSGYGACFWNDFCLRSELMEHGTRLMPGGVLIITCVIKRSGTDRGVWSLPHWTTQRAPTNRSQSSDKQGCEKIHACFARLFTSQHLEE